MLHITTATATAKSLQSCPTLCDPTDGSPPGSAVPGILQARTLEWVGNLQNGPAANPQQRLLGRVIPLTHSWRLAGAVLLLLTHTHTHTHTHTGDSLKN